MASADDLDLISLAKADREEFRSRKSDWSVFGPCFVTNRPSAQGADHWEQGRNFSTSVVEGQVENPTFPWTCLVLLWSRFSFLNFARGSKQANVDKKLAVEKDLAACNEKIANIAKQISFVESMSEKFTSTSSSQLDYQISALMQVIFDLSWVVLGFSSSAVMTRAPHECSCWSRRGTSRRGALPKRWVHCRSKN